MYRLGWAAAVDGNCKNIPFKQVNFTNIGIVIGTKAAILGDDSVTVIPQKL